MKTFLRPTRRARRTNEKVGFEIGFGLRGPLSLSLCVCMVDIETSHRRGTIVEQSTHGNVSTDESMDEKKEESTLRTLPSREERAFCQGKDTGSKVATFGRAVGSDLLGYRCTHRTCDVGIDASSSFFRVCSCKVRHFNDVSCTCFRFGCA